MSVRSWGGLALALAALVALVGGILSVVFDFNAVADLNAKNQLVSRSREVIDTTQAIVSQLTEAESGVRAFLLTENSNHLEGLRRAKKLLPQSAVKLVRLVAGNSPEKNANSPEMTSATLMAKAVAGRLADLETDVKLRREGGLQAVVQRAQREVGTRDMRRVYSARNSIVNTENAVLKGRESQAKETRIRTYWTIGVSIVSLIAIFSTVILGFARLTSQHRRFQILVDSIGDGFYSLDRDWRIVHFNRAAEQLLGKPARTVLKRRIFEAFPQKEGTIIERRLRDVIYNHAPQFFTMREPVSGLDLEYRIFPAEGGVSVFLHDIAERVAAEREIHQLNESLEERVLDRTAQLEGFCYSIAHDMRMHIRGVSLNATLLAEECRNQEASDDLLQKLKRSTSRMAELVDDLLSFARTSAKRISRAHVNLSAKALEIIKSLRDDEPEARDVTFRVPEELVADADPQLASVVLYNLIDNAYKYRAHDRAAVIELGITRTEDGDAFFVRDNGVGFDPKFAERAFQPFERLHSDQAIRGSGIGLASVRRIVERHGGKIWVESEPGKGTIFFFTFGEHSSRKTEDAASAPAALL